MSKPIRIWDPLDVRPAARPWIWAVLAALVSLTQGPSFVDSLRPGPREGVDFFQEWASAKNLFQGVPIYMDLEKTADLYLGYKRAPGEEILFTKNAHPPTSILLALPFARMSYPVAMLAWNLMSLAFFGMTLWLTFRALGFRLDAWLIFPAIALFLICNPVRQQVNQGQLNLVLLLLLTCLWLADRAGRLRTAGILLGAATAIKLFPAFFFLYFILRKRWTVAAYGIAAFVTATAITVAILGVEAYRSYITEVVPQVSTYRNGWINASLAGLWTKWFDAGALSPMPLPGLPRHLSPLVKLPALASAGLVASSLVVLLLWARAVLRSRSLPTTDLAFGLTLITMLLISPLTWDHYFLLLLLPLVQLWIGLSDAKRARIVLFLLLACLWTNPLLFWTAWLPASAPADLPGRVWSLTVVSLHSFALIGVYILGLVHHGTLVDAFLHESRSNRKPSGSSAPIAPLSGTSAANVRSSSVAMWSRRPRSLPGASMI